MRTGLLARKLGMSRVFAEDGAHVPVTVLEIDDCQVVAQRTRETHGYDAVQLGASAAKVKRVSKAMRGHFAKANVEPKQKLAEFRVSADALLEPGVELGAGHFIPGQRGRRGGHDDRQGVRRRDQAPPLQRARRHARGVGVSSLPRLDRA